MKNFLDKTLRVAYIPLALFMLVFSLPCAAAEPAVAARGSVDKQQVTIGDPLTYTVAVTAPKGTHIRFPEKTTDLGPWSVQDLQASREEKNEQDVHHLVYTLTAFTTGEALIPELAFSYTDAAGKTQDIKTAPVPVMVESLLTKYGDNGDIRDIKPPIAFRTPLLTYILWLLVLAAILGGAYAWYARYKKQNEARFPVWREPPRPPREVALEELEKLKGSGLLSEGRIKEFYIALVDIVRAYIAPVYGVETRDKTTHEIYLQLRTQVQDRKTVTSIKEFLDVCDLVKFAKYYPEEKVCWGDWDTAKTIVQQGAGERL